MSEREIHNPFAAPAVQDVPVSADGSVNFAELQSAKTGLGLIYISLIMTVLLVIGTAAGGYFLAAGSWSRLPLIVLPGLIGLVAGLMSLIGGFLCIAIPAESGAKGFAVASVVFHCIQLLLGILIGATTFLFGGVTFSVLMANSPLKAISVLLFVFYLRRLARYIRRDDLVRRASRMLIFGATFFVGCGLILVFLLGAGGAEVLAMLIIGGGMLMALMLFVMYANLVNGVRQAIGDADRLPDPSFSD